MNYDFIIPLKREKPSVSTTNLTIRPACNYLNDMKMTFHIHNLHCSEPLTWLKHCALFSQKR